MSSDERIPDPEPSDPRGEGEPRRVTALVPLVYEELRQLARLMVGSGEDAGAATLQPTALVHAAYLKLARSDTAWQGRSHFYCVAAKAMRQLIRDAAREHRTHKRGSGWKRVTLTGISGSSSQPGSLIDLLVLDEALEELTLADPRAAEIVELRFFCGLTIQEVAERIAISASTVKADWQAARTWLRHRLSLPRKR